MLSLLSPVLSRDILLQLADIQQVTDFSDSSDSKNREKLFLRTYRKRRFSVHETFEIAHFIGVVSLL